MDAKELERRAKDPSTPSPSYGAMLPRWALMDAILGGTEAMRAAGEAYLPRHQAECDIGYQDRLQSAVLYNMTEHTLESLTGRPFRTEPQVTSDTPGAIRTLLDDVDLQGTALGPFARDWFRRGFAKAFCAVLVDFPVKDPKVKTKDDEVSAGLRPYWAMISPENILAADSTIVNGSEKLTHVRLLESYDEKVGFATVSKRRIRVLTPGQVQFWNEVTEQGKAKWIEQPPFPVDIQEIPLVIWYSTARQAPLLAKPRLLDQAELNKCHWQSTADQRHILTVCRFPILAASGCSGPSAADDGADTSMVIGPDKINYIPEAQGKLYYVEHSGAAIEAGRNDLKDLEQQMASYGAEFLKEKTGTETATAAAIDSAESTSELAAMARTFQDAVAQAFYFTGLWLKLGDKPTGSITLDTSWTHPQDAKDAKESPAIDAAKQKEIQDAKQDEDDQEDHAK